MSFDITPCGITHVLVCGNFSSGLRLYEMRFTPEYQVKFVDWFLFAFTDFSLWTETWVLSSQKFVNHNSFDKEFTV